jgi:hypothetical protein
MQIKMFDELHFAQKWYCKNGRFDHILNMTEMYAKLEHCVHVWWAKLYSIWYKAAEILLTSSDIGRLMSTLYCSTTDTNFCKGSIMRVNARLKNNKTLRAVVKQSVNKQNKLILQSVLELHEAAPWFVS